MTEWELIDEEFGIWAAEYPVGNSGFVSRSVAVRIAPSRFLVYGPGRPVLETSLHSWGQGNEITALITPNHFHYLGLESWKNAFPNAIVAASANAKRRLLRKGLNMPAPISKVRTILPDHVELLEPASDRIGEVWLTIRRPGGNIWVVGDAWFNLQERPKSHLKRMMYTFLNNSPGLKMSRLYVWVCIRNKKNYRDWVRESLAEHSPRILIPSHGDILNSTDLPSQLEESMV